MYNTCNAGLKKLENILDNCEDLYDILSCYIGSKDIYDIIEDLKCNDTLYSMAEDNDITESEMEEWIHGHWDSFVSCKIFQERGHAGGWPVVKVDCLNMVFFFDWVTE